MQKEKRATTRSIDYCNFTVSNLKSLWPRRLPLHLQNDFCTVVKKLQRIEELTSLAFKNDVQLSL